jgi:hypothetical protein
MVDMMAKALVIPGRWFEFACGVALLCGCNASPTPPTSAPLVAIGSGGPTIGAASAGAPPPAFGSTEAIASPPPISGGSLLVTFDGNTAVVSDPDRDVIDVVNLTSRGLAFTIALQPGDEPGRLAEDATGRVHVALRGGGALITLDPTTGTVLARRAVCPAPRGVAWAAATDVVWVACATGELVALPSAGGSAVQSSVVERDLRDVIARPDGTLLVSKFRSAEVLTIGSDGTVVARNSLPSPNSRVSAAQVAWRMIAGPSPGSAMAVYQVESTTPISTTSPGGYSGGGVSFGTGALTVPDGGGFGALPAPRFPLDGGAPLPFGGFGGGPIASTMTVLDGSGIAASPAFVNQAVLPVDIALSPDGNMAAIASAGGGFSISSSFPNIFLMSVDGSRRLTVWSPTMSPVVAVAFDGKGNVLAQSLEPAQLFFVPIPGVPLSPNSGMWVTLSTESRHNTGSDIFHTQAGGLIACASCHPEGGDDGHIWLLDGLPRRTPSLRGTIAGTAPYHWPGDELDMGMLIDDVYTRRMSGAMLAVEQRQVLTDWVESIPAPPAPSWVDASSAQRGQVLFEGTAGCSSCHSGAKFTNNATVSVGTGHDVGSKPDGGAPPTAFQVPPLVGVGWRTPLFHDGCAGSVAERFGRCATPEHGSTGQLSSQDIQDLTAYLESL